jgi:hypothetical protein
MANQVGEAINRRNNYLTRSAGGSAPLPELAWPSQAAFPGRGYGGDGTASSGKGAMELQVPVRGRWNCKFR